MKYVKHANHAPVAIEKAVFTVGWGPGFDLNLGEGPENLCFSIQKEEGSFLLVPGNERLRLNGRIVSGPETIQCCDRVSWREDSLCFLSDIGATSTTDRTDLGVKCLQILERLSTDLENSESLSGSLRQALSSMAEAAGAQGGNLVAEMDASAGWEMLASFGIAANPGSEESSRRVILSHTAVNEAIRTRKPVYVESIVGHDWASQASILGARVFSLACLPLVVGDRIFGCVYLFTRTPGKSIDRTSLQALNLLGTQIALILATRAQLNRSQIRKLTGGPTEKSLVYDKLDEQNPMRALDARLGKLATSDLSLLVLGETGSGKEIIAREIHKRSARASKPFVAVNCGAIPPSLIESTLFGYVKGAFTGALKDQDGKFVQAEGGTLFLDEIGDLPLDLQVKLLRVLQEKMVEPVGGVKSIAADFRLVAATHQDLEQHVKSGKFRQDLYYRLNGATLKVPALRERTGDIPLLATHFLSQVASDRKLSAQAKRQLCTHTWPGNVRELEQVIHRAAALSEGEEISAEALEMGVLSASLSSNALDMAEMPQGLREAQEAFTREFVRAALEQSGGSRAKAAAKLGISERTLYRILSAEINDTTV